MLQCNNFADHKYYGTYHPNKLCIRYVYPKPILILYVQLSNGNLHDDVGSLKLVLVLGILTLIIIHV